MAVSDDDLAHLLRRTEFVVRPARLAELKSLDLTTYAAVVDNVLNVGLNGSPTLPAYFQTEAADNWDQYVQGCTFWIDSMLTRPRPILEKMTLFWHGHFVSAWWDVGHGFHLMQQTQMYRENALGNFHTLTQKMAIDRAMLVYLSNAENVKGSPNQNFARELMELFTLGVGNYTEGDVEAAARAWTGHNADWPEYNYVFKANRHDIGMKTFFGTTKNWDGPQIIDEILIDNAAKKQIAARYITKKLWEFLAHPTPPTAVLDALAPAFATDMNILNLVRGNPQPSRVLQQHGTSKVSCGHRSSSSWRSATTRAWTQQTTSASRGVPSTRVSRCISRRTSPAGNRTRIGSTPARWLAAPTSPAPLPAGCGRTAASTTCMR